MVLPIYVYGSSVLTTRADEIDESYPEIKQLIEDMFDTMAFADGVGLAAPQIGKSIRVFVLDASPFAEDDPTLANIKKVFINPIVVERAGKKEAFYEGCLSFPKLNEDVYREPKVLLNYLDENFEEHEEWFDGILARIIQHEYDHLEGILFIDRIPGIRKKLLSSKLKRLTRGDYSTKYKTKIQ